MVGSQHSEERLSPFLLRAVAPSGSFRRYRPEQDARTVKESSHRYRGREGPTRPKTFNRLGFSHDFSPD